MVTQFVLRTDKKDSAGRCPVHLVVYFDGTRLKCSTDEKCKPSEWNADRQQFRAGYTLAEEANDMLKRLEKDVLAWWRKLWATGDTPTLACGRCYDRWQLRQFYDSSPNCTRSSDGAE